MTDNACVYCDVECDTSDVEHKNDCPSVTGLYPVREQELGPKCVHCGKPSIGMQCAICHQPFEVGDSYVLVGGQEKPVDPAPGIEGAYFAGTVTCVVCALGTLDREVEA